MSLLQKILALAKKHDIQCVFFDIGQVLVLLDFEQKKQATIDFLQTDETGYKKFFDAAIRDYFLGKVDAHTFDEIAQNMFGITASLSSMRAQETQQQRKINTEVTDVLPELAQRFRLSIISNLLPDSYQLFIQSDIAAYFQYPIFSNIVGVRKPDPAIYKLALRVNHTTPQQAIFIDDKPKNIEAANALGIHTLLYTPPPL